MFSFFKKQIHESLELQKEDIIDCAGEINASHFLNGESCDQITGGYGEFGSITNPIPVNGPMGEIKYLGKLRKDSGLQIFFHRTCSALSQITSNMVDIYEIVCVDGTSWNQLCFCMYHPRRSNMAPNGYYLQPVDKKLGMDLPYVYGINEFVEDFPFSLPSKLVEKYDDHITHKLANQAQTFINKFHLNFVNNKPE